MLTSTRYYIRISKLDPVTNKVISERMKSKENILERTGKKILNGLNEYYGWAMENISKETRRQKETR